MTSERTPLTRNEALDLATSALDTTHLLAAENERLRDLLMRVLSEGISGPTCTYCGGADNHAPGCLLLDIMREFGD